MSLSVLLTPAREPPVRPVRRVATCYSLFDAFFPQLGLFDLTEGLYDHPDTSFEQAQANQHNYLLDQIGCGPGFRVLDIGCGYGTLLKRAADRGASGVGLTLSCEQAEQCQAAGLEVSVLDYKRSARSGIAASMASWQMGHSNTSRSPPMPRRDATTPCIATCSTPFTGCSIRTPRPGSSRRRSISLADPTRGT